MMPARERTPIDVLCVGETMAVLAPEDALPFRVGGPLALHVGGAESNVAGGLAAAGHRVAWVSRVGRDAFGDLIVDELAASGIDVSYVERTAAPTGVYFKSPENDGVRPLYYRSGSAASTMDAPFADHLAERVQPRLVHVSGITAQISATGLELLRRVCVDRVFADALVSFDVNHRPALADAATPDALLALARAADVCFVGADEAARVWGVSAAQIPELLRGPRHLVVKDADVDAVEYTGAVLTRVPAARVEVVEPTGAGDAFAAGWLDAYLAGASAHVRLEAGHRRAALALTSHGDTSHGTGAR